MKFGISLPSFGHMACVENIRQVALQAEKLEYYCIWAAERLLVPIPPNQSWSQRNPTAFEPLTTLAYIAAMTQSIRLCTSIVILPVRNPLLLARLAASLDVLSNGRLELGVGIGWMREEMEASGVPFGKRGKIADEYIQLLRHAWRAEEFKGRFVEVPPHLFEPKPVKGQIPIWVGGNSDAALSRAARLGDGWIAMGTLFPDELVTKVSKISKMAKESGRTGQIRIACNHGFGIESLKDLRQCIDIIEAYRNAGATQIIPRFDSDSIPNMIDLMTIFANEVIPNFR